MKQKLIWIFIFTLAMGYTASAQDYKTGVGLRLGPSYGLSVKHFVKSNAALEGLLYTRRGGFALTGLYEFHGVAFQTAGLKYYVGGGAHIGSWDGYRNYSWYNGKNGDRDGRYTTFGLDFIIGLEYTFREAPFSLSLDWKPAINLSNYGGYWGDDVGLTIRYTFK